MASSATAMTATTPSSIASRVNPRLLIYLAVILFIIAIVLFLIGGGILCGAIRNTK